MGIRKTIVHLKDCKGWNKVIEHDGDCSFEGIYLERRIPDTSKPMGELIPDNHKYYYVKEEFCINDVKHVYFEET